MIQKLRAAWRTLRFGEVPAPLEIMPMEEWFIEHVKPVLEAQLKPHLKQMIRISQQNHAMQYVLDTLMLAHPDPARLMRVWQQVQPEMIEQLIDHPPPEGEEEFKQDVLDAWQE